MAVEGLGALSHFTTIVFHSGKKCFFYFFFLNFYPLKSGIFPIPSLASHRVIIRGSWAKNTDRSEEGQARYLPSPLPANFSTGSPSFLRPRIPVPLSARPTATLYLEARGSGADDCCSSAKTNSPSTERHTMGHASEHALSHCRRKEHGLRLVSHPSQHLISHEINKLSW